jgi:hypothetical protein
VNLTVVRSYREAMWDMSRMSTLDIWYARLSVEDIEAAFASRVKPKVTKRFEKNVAKAGAKDSLKAFDKLVEIVDGQPRLIGDPPLIVPIEDLVPDMERDQIEERLRGLIRSYRRTLPGDRRHLLDAFRYAGGARKVVGVGSVGTRAWVFLMLGNADDEPLFLQAKEAQASVLESFLPRSRYANHGQRVVEGQRLLQSASDILLGWVRASGIDGLTRDFYLRQLWDGKGSAVVDAMDPSTMAAYASLCGWTLAHSHARSGDPAAIAGYLGTTDTFDRALASFAEAYADQNEKDYAALEAAAATGRATVEYASSSR